MTRDISMTAFVTIILCLGWRSPWSAGTAWAPWPGWRQRGGPAQHSPPGWSWIRGTAGHHVMSCHDYVMSCVSPSTRYGDTGLIEYRTAEFRLDFIDLLAFMAFHLSLDVDCSTAESSFVRLMDKSPLMLIQNAGIIILMFGTMVLWRRR